MLLQSFKLVRFSVYVLIENSTSQEAGNKNLTFPPQSAAPWHIQRGEIAHFENQ